MLPRADNVRLFLVSEIRESIVYWKLRANSSANCATNAVSTVTTIGLERGHYVLNVLEAFHETRST